MADIFEQVVNETVRRIKKKINHRKKMIDRKIYQEIHDLNVDYFALQSKAFEEDKMEEYYRLKVEHLEKLKPLEAFAKRRNYRKLLEEIGNLEDELMGLNNFCKAYFIFHKEVSLDD